MSSESCVKIQANDPREINWAEDITRSEIEEILSAEFTEYESAHPDHSCECIGEDQNNRFLLKHKERNYATEQTEFDSLKIWRDVLNDYQDHHNTGIHSPRPYCHTEREGIVMELINGEDWAPLDLVHTDNQGEQILKSKDDAKTVTYRIGALAKIMDNEGLYHGDIANRHILIDKNNYDIGVIDLEGVSRAESQSQIDKEKQQLREVAGHIGKMKAYKESKIDSWFNEGYESIGDEKLSGALDKHGFDGFSDDYNFDRLRKNIDYTFNCL